jgi:hypothetical protein
MDIKMVDVTIHVDETLSEQTREELADMIRAQKGVIGLGSHADKPHLFVIEYNPEETNSSDLLKLVKEQGVHAELIGL